MAGRGARGGGGWMALGVVLALTAAACGSEVGAPAVPTTTLAPATTSIPMETTSPSAVASTSTTTTEPTTTTTEPVVSPGLWDPPCIERSQPASAPALDEEELAVFGPLGAEPLLDIDLPAHGPSQAQTVDDSVGVVAARIPGGLLLLLRPTMPPTFGVQLVAIDDAGTVRWVRCLPDDVWRMQVGPATASPDLAYLPRVERTGSIDVRWSWAGIGLADGSDRPVPDELDGRQPIRWTEDRLLLGPVHDRDRAVDPATDDVLLLDLASGTTETLPLPPLAPGTTVAMMEVALSDDGVPFTSTAHRMVSAVYVGGGWSQDPAVIDATLPLSVEFDYGGEAPWLLDGRTASGDVVWTRDDLTDIGGEGFRVATDGDVTVVAVCIERASPWECTRTALVGLDTATGATVWQRDDGRSVQAIGDGFAIVVDAPGYVLVDVSTGEPVPDQRWTDPAAFASECCGGGDYVWVQREGGVVFAHDYGRVRVWYPLGAPGPPGAVTLDL